MNREKGCSEARLSDSSNRPLGSSDKKRLASFSVSKPQRKTSEAKDKKNPRGNGYHHKPLLTMGRMNLEQNEDDSDRGTCDKTLYDRMSNDLAVG
jgi:hypothetical protein